MHTEKDLHEYQQHMIGHAIDNTHCMLAVGMGLGKTVSVLTAINRLRFDMLEAGKALVIAPKKVTLNVWPNEPSQWAHLKHLRISIITGTPGQRIKAIQAKADVYVIGRDNFAWLVAYLRGAWPWEVVVADESSSFKNPRSKRFLAFKVVQPKMGRVINMTGTPTPNSLRDIWSQIYMLDRGQRLGTSFEGFTERFFDYDQYTRRHTIKKGDGAGIPEDYYSKKIYGLIADIVISMKEEDYLTLPERMDIVTEITLPDDLMDKYIEFEKEKVLEIAGEEITVMNALALSSKLLQFANGAVYDENKDWHVVHDEKLDMLVERIEDAGEPVLIFYEFQHDRKRIIDKLKHLRITHLDGEGDERRWNNKEFDVAIVHPASAGHGLNLQYGCCLCEWFGVTWSLEAYQQGMKRVHRQGQLRPVVNNHLLVRGTMDFDVWERLSNKAADQDALLNAVKARIKKYLK